MGSNPFLGTTPSTRTQTRHLPRWRNWYTRTFEGRMTQVIRVQVPAWAPIHWIDIGGQAAAVFFCDAVPGRLAQLVRAPRLHRGCRGFESLTAHHSTPDQDANRAC